ncbi:MAG: endonuclease [Prevotella sp.]|nr:endonuclease [Prevotella sp.]MCM1074896.1 endonuclease [Ruminococcus sp.]
MKRIFSLILALSGTLLLIQAAPPASYYLRMDGKKKEELKTAAFEVIRPHTVVTYNSLFPQQFPKTDVYPELYNGQQRWWEMYSDMIFLVRNGWSGMNREHSFPKSWWGGAQNEAYTDLNHLYPSESEANMAKSNYPLGEVQRSTFNNGVTTVGYAYAGQGGGAGQVFEPADEYKGDFARTYFYIATCYQDYTWKYTYMVQNGTYPTLKPWAYELLLDWARRDPVSQKEIDRNEAVYQIQGNRNPFIDFPELAEYIWGTRTNETFYIKDQQGSVTPPITGDPELFAPIDGSSLDFGQVAVGKSQTVDLLINGVNLTSALSVRVTGTDRRMFSIQGISNNQIPASSINSDTGYKLSLRYTPTSVGNHTAAITLYDGGFPDGTNFNVSIHGEAFPTPTLTALEALPATDISATGYIANWNLPPDGEVVDYYMVNRTRYLSSGAVTTRLAAEENRLEIDERQSDVAESYTVQSVRLGYESPESNMIMVAAGALAGVEMNEPLLAAYIPGGLRILLHSEQTNLRIVNTAGVCVHHQPSIAGETQLLLPPGVYFLTTDQSQRPVTVLVR